jgi:hypothetical protein
MQANRLLSSAAFAIGACVALSGSHADTQALPSVVHVGPNVQVSAAKGSTMHGEGMIAVDPTDARRLVVCSMFRETDLNQGVAVYASRDGGAHWERTFQTPAGQPSGDPACAFGPDGIAYLTMIVLDTSSAKVRQPIVRSEDGGQSWRAAGVTGYLDRESIVVDGTNGPFHNRVYVHGVADSFSTTAVYRSAVVLYASPDGGRTFGRPAERVAFDRRYAFSSSNGVVLSDGRWAAVFLEFKKFWDAADNNVLNGAMFQPPPEPENAWLKVVTSDDGGDSLNEPVTISGWHVPNPYVRQSSTIPSLAVDSTKGAFGDRLYTVWGDSRFGGIDILLSYSADRGKTWSAPIVVNDDRHPLPRAAAPNHILPTVAVNAAGVVAVTWLDRRDAPDNLGWRERMRVSLDGGETFLPSNVVAEAPTRFDGREHWPVSTSTVGGGTPFHGGGLVRLLAFAPLHLYFPGDYAGLTADRDGIFHPYWIDNRTGWHQVWTAPVTVAAAAMKNGAADLSVLDDLTQLTTLTWERSDYDRDTETVTVKVHLDNTSRHTLEGPFKIRLIQLDSDVAALETIGASNDLTGPGAVWDVTSFTDASRLKPGGTSRPFALTFKLHDVRPFVQGHTTKFDFRLVTAFSRVLGHIAK